MFLIETINHCPKLVTAGHTDYSRLKRVVQGFLSLSCLTQTYCTHFISSFSCHFIAFISLVSHILSDIWHLLFITALVKAEPMVSCAPEWTVLSLLLKQRIAWINYGVGWMWNLNQALHTCPHRWTWGGSYATSTLGKEEERVIWPWVHAPLTDVPWTECDNETDPI